MERSALKMEALTMRKLSLRGFWRGRRGSLAVTGAVAGGVATMSVLLTMALINAEVAREDMQRGLDAALLTAARRDDFRDPQQAVQAQLASFIKDSGVKASKLTVTATFDKDQGLIIGEASFDVPATAILPNFLSEPLRPSVKSEVRPPGAHRMEIALALDMSGSMSMDLAGNPGFAAAGASRLDALRAALNELFNDIEAQRTEHGSSIYVSIVPYAGSVNIGNLYKGVGLSSSIRSRQPQSGGPEPHAFFTKLGDNDQRLRTYYDLGNWTTTTYCVTQSWWGCTRTESYQHWSKADDMNAPYLKRGVWATERVGTNLGSFAKDLAPDEARVPFATFEDIRELERTKRNNSTAFDKSWVTPALHVLPLTNDVAEMRAYADNLVAYGGTSGHLGMEWAWRAISPNWSGAWAFKPTDAQGKFRPVTEVLPKGSVAQLLESLLVGVGDLLNQTVGGLLGLLGLGGSSTTNNAANYVTADRLPSSYDAVNTSKTIVMMTDGVFSPVVDTSVAAALAGKSSHISAQVVQACLEASSLQSLTGQRKRDAEAACRASFGYFENICEQAKRSGVTVYTIAFTQGADGSLESLRRCASDSSKSFGVNTGVQLKTAFTRIFMDTNNMHVSR